MISDELIAVLAGAGLSTAGFVVKEYIVFVSRGRYLRHLLVSELSWLRTEVRRLYEQFTVSPQQPRVMPIPFIDRRPAIAGGVLTHPEAAALSKFYGHLALFNAHMARASNGPADLHATDHLREALNMLSPGPSGSSPLEEALQRRALLYYRPFADFLWG